MGTQESQRKPQRGRNNGAGPKEQLGDKFSGGGKRVEGGGGREEPTVSRQRLCPAGDSVVSVRRGNPSVGNLKELDIIVTFMVNF